MSTLNKLTLQSFVSKYNLNGLIESANIVSTGTGVSVRCATEARDVIANISHPALELPEGKFAVVDTKQLRSVLNVLGDTLTMKLKTHNGKVIAFEFKDTDGMKAVVALADSRYIQDVSAMKGTPHFEVSIILNRKFIDAFSKSLGAINDVEEFTVTSDGTTSQIILGDADTNSTHITIAVDTTSQEALPPLKFSAVNFKSIIMANKDATEGILEVSKAGLARIRWTVDAFGVEYILVKKRNN